jgi:hypothetical protein
MKKIIAILFIVFTITKAYSQGCSDAGFCTMDAFKPAIYKDSLDKNQVKIGFSYGQADHDISVFGNYLEYNRQFSNKFGLDFKLTSLAQKGNNISVFGLSDFYLNGNWQLNSVLKLTLGGKIPMNNGNKTINTIALPMDYQASLGTFDFIAGLGISLPKLKYVIAFQQPISQNSNQFKPENFGENSVFRKFQNTYQFKRKGDVLFRASYPVILGKKLNFTPSLLGIYHLGEDGFTNVGHENTIIGSSGLTLNGNVYFDYNFNKKNALQLNIGSPFIVRKTRPDGLTRSIVANIEYKIRF